MAADSARFTPTWIIVGLSLAIIGCSKGTMPATVSDVRLPPTAYMTAVSLGNDGRIWFAFSNAGPGPGVGYVDSNGDVEMTQLDPVTYGHMIGDLAVDAKHGVWATLPCRPFGSRCNSGFARFGGDFGPLTQIHSLGNPDTVPLGIALAQDGGVWIAERDANAIVHITPNDKQTVIKLSDRDFRPAGAQVSDDGGAYFHGLEPGIILAVNPKGRIKSYVVPARTSHTSSAKQGLNGKIWVAEYDADKIVAIDRGGNMTEYAVPTPNAGPNSIAIDRDGVAWFTEYNAEKLGRVDPDGTVKDAYLPIDVGRPGYLVATPNGTLVVVGHNRGIFGISQKWKIARIPEASAIPQQKANDQR